MGHGDARSEEPDQSNVNSEPEQEDYVHGGAETSLDLRKLRKKGGKEALEFNRSTGAIRTWSNNVPFMSTAATRTCGVGCAQTRDGGLPEEVQRPAETKGRHPDNDACDQKLFK